jgi:hypothetical protein
VRVPAEAKQEASVTIRASSKVSAPDVADRTVKILVK